MRANYRAPWARSLKWMTAFCIAIFSAIVLIGSTSGPRDSALWLSAMIAAPLALLLGGLCFLVRGYTLGGNTLTIHRAGWNSRVDLRELQSAEADKDAMAKSIRLFGNGGLFCFAGLFRNRKLGNYRVFATDPSLAVVLRFETRTIVVSPHDPEGFADTVNDLHPRTRENG